MVTKNKGGGSLVQVDSKLFEISEELLNRKISGAIPQRGISFSPRMSLHTVGKGRGSMSKGQLKGPQ